MGFLPVAAALRSSVTMTTIVPVFVPRQWPAPPCFGAVHATVP